MQTGHPYKTIKIPRRTIIPSLKPPGHKTPTKPQRPLKRLKILNRLIVSKTKNTKRKINAKENIHS